MYGSCSKKQVIYGFYSEKQKASAGSVIYLTPEGREVEVTEVDSDPNGWCLWPDKQNVGIVLKYVREHSKPKINILSTLSRKYK